MTLEKVPFGGQLVQCMYDACGVKMQVGDNLICGERTMGFRVTGHSPGHVIGGKFVPESPLLQLLLNFSDHIRIEHLGHVGGAEQSLKHLRVQGQQLCAALGLRLIVLVHHRAHEAEEDILGERRRRLGFHVLQGDGSGVQSGHHLVQCGHVVDVLQAFARGLQKQRKVFDRACGLQELCATKTLLPERHTTTRIGAGHEQ